jgi:porin
LSRPRRIAGLTALPALMLAGEAMAGEVGAWKGQAIYTADLVATPSGPGRAWVLDNLDLVGDLDLHALTGARGATLHADVLVNGGGQPDGALGTLEGLDNIEVARPRARLFEAWLQQDFGDGRGSVRAGLYDLNSEFYATEASAQLIHPAFGIGTELSTAGSGGPSIFPSTALAIRLRWQDGYGRYVQAAVLDAKAGTLGDPGGVDLSLAEGALGIVQVGGGEASRWALGAWRYGAGDGAGTPGARGVYGLWEHDLAADGARRTTLFVRGGVAGGGAPVRASLQAGAMRTGVWPHRPDSQLSIGVHAARAHGGESSEFGVEAAYADKVTQRLTLQPGLQYVSAPDGRNIVLASLRFILEAW